MQRLLTSTFLLAVAMVLAGDGYAQTSDSTPAAKTAAAPAATTTKAPVKKTGTATATKSAAAKPLTTKAQKFSYALGMNIGKNLGSQLKQQSVDVDWSLVGQGLKDATSAGGKTQLTEDEAKAVLTEVQSDVQKQQQEKMKATGEKNKTDGDAFLAANKSKEGVVTLPSGLQYKILKVGEGAKPTATDSVVCNYRGTLVNGTEFDSSYKRGQPATFGVGQVIKGWTEALQLMPVGSKWQLFVPASLGYGERGEPRGGIEPNATLIFDVELMSIVDKTKTDEKKEDKSEEKKEDKKDDKQ